MNLWRSLEGMVEAELTCADPGGAFDAINRQGIPVYQVRQIRDLTLGFQIRRKDYTALCALCKKRGDILKLTGKQGLYWAFGHLLRRPLLTGGMALLLCLIFYLPSRVLFVRVEGNSAVPANKILEAAEESGICFGASRREVRSERVKNALLGAVPELQWAGVNTSGCVAVISVRERTTSETEQKDMDVSSIVAACDGIIISATVTRGNGLCQPGQAVKAGQVLISGYTDCGLCIQATRAEGEVFAMTRREISSLSPAVFLQKGQIKDEVTRFSFLVGKKRINLWKDSGIWEGSCGRMYEEYYITLPGGFRLPLAVIKETITTYDTQPVEQTVEAAESELCAFSDSYLSRHMVAGQILERQVETVQDNGAFRMNAVYLCTEMIGRVRQEKIGEYNGKTD
jgi:sporulation protein YqfD